MSDSPSVPPNQRSSTVLKAAFANANSEILRLVLSYNPKPVDFKEFQYTIPNKGMPFIKWCIYTKQFPWISSALTNLHSYDHIIASLPDIGTLRQSSSSYSYAQQAKVLQVKITVSNSGSFKSTTVGPLQLIASNHHAALMALSREAEQYAKGMKFLWKVEGTKQPFDWDAAGNNSTVHLIAEQYPLNSNWHLTRSFTNVVITFK